MGAAMKSMEGSEPFRSMEGSDRCSKLGVWGALSHFGVRAL
jgi:hypothetical protein